MVSHLFVATEGILKQRAYENALSQLNVVFSFFVFSDGN